MLGIVDCLQFVLIKLLTSEEKTEVRRVRCSTFVMSEDEALVLRWQEYSRFSNLF